MNNQSRLSAARQPLKVVDIQTRRSPVTRDTLPVTLTLSMVDAEALYVGRTMDDTGKQSVTYHNARMTLWDAIVDALRQAGFPHPWEGDAA